MRKGVIEQRIPVSGPWITQKEIDYVTDAVTNAWYANANRYHERFEASFAEYVGARYAMALPSCTSGIHLALAALNVGPGDEVIVPEITWIATSAPIQYVGATPVFADIDPRTWCLSAESFEAHLSPRTRAVIPVDLYGNLPDWATLSVVAERHGVAIVEDAAEAIGSEFRGGRAGSFGRAGVFSFHGSKTLTTGEGGMLVTDDSAFLARAQFLRDHGRRPGDTMFFNAEVAFKYKMSSMQAALGLAQLERIDELVDRKREIFSWYVDALDGVPGISLNRELPGTKNTYWMVTAVWEADRKITKEEVILRMREDGIDCRPFFHPLSSLPAYSSHTQAARARRENPVSYDLSQRAINLPSGFDLTTEKVHRVMNAFRKVIGA